MRYCAVPGCSKIVPRGRCARHQVDADHARPNFEIRRLYRTARWRELRARVLAEEPRCPGRGDGIPCGHPTVDVHHRVKHHGDPRVFFDRGILEAKCHRCHSATTVRETTDARR